MLKKEHALKKVEAVASVLEENERLKEIQGRSISPQWLAAAEDLRDAVSTLREAKDSGGIS